MINKIDLAPQVGASFAVMEADSKMMRKEKAFVFTNLKTGQGVQEIISFIIEAGMLSPGGNQ